MGIDFNNVGKGDYITPHGPRIGNNNKAANVANVSAPIPVTGGTDSVKRTDLDMVNPYGFLGVNISTKPNNVSQVIDNYYTAAPELHFWNGNFAITDKQEATDFLGAYAKAVQDYEQVAQNLQGSPFAELFG